MPDPVPTVDAAPPAAIAPTSVQPPAEPTPPAPVVEPPKAPETPKEPVAADPNASPLGVKKDGDPPPAEPIKYDFKVPEGMKLDEKQIAAFTDLGNKHKIAPEVAQELFDLHTSQVKDLATAAVAAVQKANTEAYDNLIGGWKKELSSDPELSGTNADAAHEILGKVLDQYGSKEAREAFDLTGAGWNPAIIRMIVSMGKALVEGGPTIPGQPAKGREPKTPGNVLYPAKTN